MKQNRRPSTTLTGLGLLLIISFPLAGSAFALEPAPPPQTLLEVKLPGGQNQWGSALNLHGLDVVTFRWKTNVEHTAYGVWEIMDYEPTPNGVNEQPFASKHVDLGQPGQFSEFRIDFAQLHHQHPEKIPASAPATAKNYYVRLVPWIANGSRSWVISPAVRISYSSRLQEGGSELIPDLKVTNVQISPNRISLLGPGTLGVYLTTSKPSSLFVKLSLSAPLFDSDHHPSFGTVENSVFVSSFHTKHFVGLFDLKGESHYYYIIEVTDKDGHKAYIQGDFEMGKLRTPLG
jgi:hypothetical protein